MPNGKNKKNILYIGNDDTFLGDLTSFSEKVFPGKCNVLAINFQDSNQFYIDLTKVLVNENINLLYFDLSLTEPNTNTYEDVIYLFSKIKKHQKWKSLPIVLLVNSEEEFKQHRHFIGAGPIYISIKIEKHSSVFEDTFYISFSEKIDFPQFALYKIPGNEQGIPHYLYSTSVVSQFNKTDIYIGTDIDYSIGDPIQVEMNLFDDFKISHFEVSHVETGFCEPPFINKLELRIPFRDPWGEIKENDLEESTFNTWYDFCKEKFTQKLYPVLCVTEDPLSFTDIISLSKHSDAHFDIIDHLQAGFELIDMHRPKIIFMELHEGEEKPSNDKNLPNNFNTINQLVNFCKSKNEYSPFLVIFNSKTEVAAISKAIQYDKIIGHPGPIRLDLVDSMVKIFTLNKRFSGHEDLNMPRRDPRRYCEVKHPVQITSLTEHEITFLSDKELPLYSLFRIDQPCSIYLTLVPPFKEYPGGIPKNKFYYMGFFCATQEDQLRQLRRFVTQLLFTEEMPTRFLFNPKFEDERAAALEQEAKEQTEKALQSHMANMTEEQWENFNKNPYKEQLKALLGSSAVKEKISAENNNKVTEHKQKSKLS